MRWWVGVDYVVDKDVGSAIGTDTYYKSFCAVILWKVTNSTLEKG